MWNRETLVAWRHAIESNGFTLLPGVFDSDEVLELSDGLESVLQLNDESSIRDRAGTVYAGRNVLSLYEPARSIWFRSPLVELLHEMLGPDIGLVRGLFFDKPPDRTWSLPWHKDLTLAVKPHESASSVFSKPTFKAGVPHVEGSLDVLRSMLTLRIHLDDVTDENGPLLVIPGSHHSGKQSVGPDPSALPVHCQRGDVLAMRPLLAHRSISSLPGTTRHRRILHLEFSGQRTLPEGFEWHEFHEGRCLPE